MIKFGLPLFLIIVSSVHLSVAMERIRTYLIASHVRPSITNETIVLRAFLLLINKGDLRAIGLLEEGVVSQNAKNLALLELGKFGTLSSNQYEILEALLKTGVSRFSRVAALEEAVKNNREPRFIDLLIQALHNEAFLLHDVKVDAKTFALSKYAEHQKPLPRSFFKSEIDWVLCKVALQSKHVANKMLEDTLSNPPLSGFARKIALYFAALSDNQAMVTFLIKSGISHDALKLALAVAEKKNYIPIRDLLLSVIPTKDNYPDVGIKEVKYIHYYPSAQAESDEISGYCALKNALLIIQSIYQQKAQEKINFFEAIVSNSTNAQQLYLHTTSPWREYIHIKRTITLALDRKMAEEKKIARKRVIEGYFSENNITIGEGPSPSVSSKFFQAFVFATNEFSTESVEDMIKMAALNTDHKFGPDEEFVVHHELVDLYNAIHSTFDIHLYSQCHRHTKRREDIETRAFLKRANGNQPLNIGFNSVGLSVDELSELFRYEMENPSGYFDARTLQNIEVHCLVSSPGPLLADDNSGELEFDRECRELVDQVNNAPGDCSKIMLFKCHNHWVPCVLSKIGNGMYLVVVDSSDRQNELALVKIWQAIKEKCIEIKTITRENIFSPLWRDSGSRSFYSMYESRPRP